MSFYVCKLKYLFMCINIALFLVLKRLPPKNGCVRKANLIVFIFVF
jgi:hypothetical protein